MNKIKLAILFETFGLWAFAILCSSQVSISIALLIAFLFILQIGLVWMVVIILKNGHPSQYTFDQKQYEDT